MSFCTFSPYSTEQHYIIFSVCYTYIHIQVYVDVCIDMFVFARDVRAFSRIRAPVPAHPP
jgi:hypothetical protein